MIMINRRKFLQSVSACISFFVLRNSEVNASLITRYELIASKSSHKFAYNLPASNLWLYNNVCPGPILTARKGEILEVLFTNNLEQPSTIHWHGIRNINGMDGVPELTQPAIEPGDSFTYRFPVNDSGTFWYHAHFKAWEQVARGLYGALIVTEQEDELNEQDILIIADDWKFTDDYQIDVDSFGNLHDWSHGGRFGTGLTINGESEIIKIPVPTNGQLRLRFINTANARILQFQILEKHPFHVISLDGAPCEPFEQDIITLSPGQRMDVIINDISDLCTLYEVSTGKFFEAAKIVPKISLKQKIFNFKYSTPWYPMPSLDNAKVIDIHMQGGAMGNLASAVFEGNERSLRDLAMNESKLWAFNGKIGGYDHTLAEVSLGETVILRIWNDTSWEHSMHLHGHHFWVQSREFNESQKVVLRDTYLMKAGEKNDLVFIADNPGLWLFHCHMLEHHAAGMGGVISIS